MIFAESFGSFVQRTKNGGGRKPLRTFKEMCEELGVNEHSMKQYFRRANAPKPRLKSYGTRVKNSWYDPQEFRRWWRQVCEERNEAQKEIA